MSSVACPNDAALERFASGLLDAQEQQQIADHLALCAHCREALSVFSSSRTTATMPADHPESKSATPITERDPLAETWAMPGNHADLDDELDLRFLDRSPNSRALGRIGKYDVLRTLGRGGMGIVFEAFDDGLHRTVAVKVMAPELAASAKARRRFVREARAAAAINHPNVVIIHSVDEQNGMPYLVMEYVGGCSLRDRLHRPPKLEPTEIVRIGAQIASGLAAAHEQGVIHRDIKPSNILLEKGVDRVKIADFGLARAAMDLTDITTLGQGVGTPAYVSPEQVTGGTTDQRSDLFSLGCVLYAMAVGHSPFKGRLALEVIRQVADHRPPPLIDRDPRIGQSLSDIVDRLLQKDPQQRYQTAREVADVLNEQLALLNQMPSDRLPTVAPSARPSRRPVRYLGTGLTALAALAVLALVAWWALPRPASNLPINKASGARPAASQPPWRIGVITVSQQGQADFSSLADALAEIGPNTTLRILDSSTYNTTVAIDDAERLHGLRIESPQHAVLETPASNTPLLSIVGTPDVVVDGLQLLAHKQQHALRISGNVSGVRVENVTCKHAALEGNAVVIVDRARGSPAAPLILRNCTFEGNFGVAVLASADSSVSYLTIEACRFRLTGGGPALTLENGLIEQVAIERNIVTGGGTAMGMHVGAGSRDVRINNNTFFEMFDWVGLNHEAIGRHVAVQRNLILQSKCLLHDGSDLRRVVDECLNDNWWEFAAGADESEVRGVCAPREPMPVLPVVSRDPLSADFLRPQPGSPLAGAKGEDFIGAVLPAEDTEHPSETALQP